MYIYIYTVTYIKTYVRVEIITTQALICAKVKPEEIK